MKTENVGRTLLSVAVDLDVDVDLEVDFDLAADFDLKVDLDVYDLLMSNSQIVQSSAALQRWVKWRDSTSPGGTAQVLTHTL